MKKKLTKLLVLLLVTALVGSLSVSMITAGDEPTVIYDGNTKKLGFKDSLFSEGEKPDLFPDLKNLMPGDQVTQDVVIGCKNLGRGERVRISLRAENPTEGYNDLLETFGHWVKLAVKKGETEITGDLSQGVLLGTLRNLERVTVLVELSVDKEAGNELQNLVGGIDWVFTADHVPYDDDDEDDDFEVDPDDPNSGGGGGGVVPGGPDDDDDLDVDPDDPNSGGGGGGVVPGKPGDPNDPNQPGSGFVPELNTGGDHLSYIIGYPDSTVRPTGIITRAEVATIFYRLLTDESRAYYWTQENNFSDVSAGDWFNNAVSTMAAAGIVNGYPDGTFRPQEPVSRAEFAAIATRFTEAGRDGVSQQYFKQYFKDVNEGDWFVIAVELAYELGWAQGYDGYYRPEDDMTRAEVMTMVNRIMERDVKIGGLLDDMVRWPDNTPDMWYYEAVQEATNSHSYIRTTEKVPNLNFCYEMWQHLLPNPDWAALERSWSEVGR